MIRKLSSSNQLFSFILWFGLIHLGAAQNIVTNPSFEDYDVCPTTYGNGGLLECTPWQNGNQATADYFNACAVGSNVWVPDNLFGSQLARTGVGYAGFYTRESSIWREYVQVPLTEPCVAGFTYVVSFYVSRADLWCGVENIGAYLSPTPPPGNDIGTFPGVTPQIEANIGFISDAENWVLITGCFTAQGGEAWITIGNFYNNANTPLDPDCMISYGSYYYIDDVSVTQGDPGGNLDLELGDPVTTCIPYEIDPGVSGVLFQWSDGSDDPTLTVNQSGMYVLTITSGCDQAVDSVQITFIGAAPVNIGPPEITLCEGQSYIINLVPGAGDYLWQDGSTTPNYIITTTGSYSVTLDDGCDITSDEIIVYFNASPEPFSLGNDVVLCEGDEITFDFDPALGNYLWQDGSTNPDYSITTSGTYSLTISNNCGSTSDQIVVTTSLGPVIDIGPSLLSLCEGENYTIQLDPALGDYLWQDGSTSSTYSITSPGNYAVTVTNECGSSSDVMDVDVSIAPEPFSLGDDTTICQGENLQISFDPDLGDFLWQDNSSSASYEINSGGIYSLTVSNACGSVSDTIAITEIQPPQIDLGPAQLNLCEGEPITINLDPAIGDYVWQDGSTSETYTISEPGSYTVTVTNSCGTASDAIEVTLIGQPLFDLGQDIVICPAQLPIILDVSDTPNATTYLWQDNSVAPHYTVTGAGMYAVTIANTCFSTTDQILVTVEDASPVVLLPSDLVLCPGETFLLDGGGLIGNYEWQDSSTSTSFLVMEEGTYSLTVSNLCGSGSDSIVVQYFDSLVAPDLGPDVSLCPGEQLIFYAEIPDVSYSWQDMSTADSMVVTLPGMYILQVTDQCSTASDSAFVSFNASPPVIDLPDSIALCSGDAVIIEAGISGVNYKWNDGTEQSSIHVTVPAMYSITVSNTCGMDADTIWVMDAGSPPVVSLDDVVSICEGESVLLAPVSSGVTNWLWQDGSTASTYNVTSSGIYVVKVSNVCGMSTDSISVSVLMGVPALNLGVDTSLCPGEILTLSINVPDVDILWSDGTTGSEFQVFTAGSISASISNQCGSSSDTLQLTLLSAAPQLNLGPDQSLCPGETIILSPDIADVTYLWQDGSTNDTFATTQAELITLIVSNVCGIDTDTLLITEDANGPDVNLGNDVVACAGQMVTLHAGISGVDYLWQDGSMMPDLSTSSSGTYILQVSNACGMDADTVMVDIIDEPPTPYLGQDTILCEGSILQLQFNADATTAIQWQDGSSAPMYNISSPGSYVITASNMCGSAADTLLVTFQAAPGFFDLGPDTVLCPGDFMVLMAPATSDHITWQDGSHDPDMMADAAQMYSLEISNSCGSVVDEITIQVDDHVPSIALEDKILLCQGETITLDVQQSFDADYQWSTNNDTPQLLVDNPGIYGVTVTTACQTMHQEVEIVAGDCGIFSIYIPNVFSPNDDQVNDEFGVSFDDNSVVETLTCSIYDRWGNQVFNTHETDFKWDGRFNNELLQPGVYAYLIQITYVDRGRELDKQFAGDVTLVR